MNQSLYEKRPRLEKSEVYAIAALVALVLVCFFFNLGGVPLLGKDEPRYAEVAREMYASGDWITPRLEGHTWFEKPALPYWLMAAGYTVFGVGEFAARWGSALCAALGAAVVYLMARSAGGARRGALAAMVLTTSGLWFAFARGASFDMPLAATMAATLGSVYAFDTSTGVRSRRLWALSVGGWAGASMLSKGLAGPLLLGLIVGAYAVVNRLWRTVRFIDLAAAAVSFLAIAAAWYVPVYSRNGWEFVDEFFVNHHFKRYLTNKYHHPQPFYFYFLIVMAGLLPWTLVFLSGARGWLADLKRRPESRDEKLSWLAALAVLVPLLFFSFSTSKLPGYILPVFPGLALLTARALDSGEREGRGRWAYFATAVILVGLGIGLALYGSKTLGAPGWVAAIIAGVPCVAALGVAISGRRGRLAAASWGVAAGAASLVVLIAVFLFAEIGRREALAELSTTANATLRPGEYLVLLGVVEYSPVFYARGRMVVDEKGEVLIADSTDQVVEVASMAHTGSVLCITDEARVGQLESDARIAVERLGAQRNRVLFRVTAR